MSGKRLAEEVARLLRRLQVMERFSDEDFVEFQAQLTGEYHAGGIPDDFYDAIRDVAEQRYTKRKHLVTLI